MAFSDARAEGEGACRAEGRASSKTVLVVLGAVAFTFAFQQTAVLPAIPTIERSLGASPSWSAWLLSGYLMVATVTTPVFGRLADLRGEARVLFVSLAVFFAGSVGAAVLPGLAALIVCRAAQGAGGAILPLSFAISRRFLDEERAKVAIAGLTGAFGAGAVVGFASGGWMTQEVSWRLVFGVGAACVAVSSLALRRVVPRAGGTAEGGMDWAGGAWLGAMSLTVLLAVTVGPQTGWDAPAPVALLAGSVFAAVMWTRTELHHPEPLVDLRVLRNRTILFVNGATASLGWGRFVGLLVVPLLVAGSTSHGGLAADATVTGAVMVPDGCGTTVGGPVAGLLARRVSPRVVLAVALLLLASGGAVLASGTSSLVHVLAGVALLGLGGGAATQATSAVTTADVPAGTAGASSALNSTVRRLAGGIGGQVSVALLASAGASHGGAGMPAMAAGGFALVFGIAAGLSGAGALLAMLTPRGCAAPPVGT